MSYRAAALFSALPHPPPPPMKKMTASVLKQDQNTQRVKKHADFDKAVHCDLHLGNEAVTHREW